MALADGLPLDGAVARSLAPDSVGVGWDAKTELLAVLAEQIDQNTRVLIMANSEKGATVPRPILIERPWKRTTPQERQSTPSQVAAFMARNGVPILGRRKKGKAKRV
jgi:hypothetical protein